MMKTGLCFVFSRLNLPIPNDQWFHLAFANFADEKSLTVNENDLQEMSLQFYQSCKACTKSSCPGIGAAEEQALREVAGREAAADREVPADALVEEEEPEDLENVKLATHIDLSQMSEKQAHMHKIAQDLLRCNRRVLFSRRIPVDTAAQLVRSILQQLPVPSRQSRTSTGARPQRTISTGASEALLAAAIVQIVAQYCRSICRNPAFHIDGILLPVRAKMRELREREVDAEEGCLGWIAGVEGPRAGEASGKQENGCRRCR